MICTAVHRATCTFLKILELYIKKCFAANVKGTEMEIQGPREVSLVDDRQLDLIFYNIA